MIILKIDVVMIVHEARMRFDRTFYSEPVSAAGLTNIEHH